MGGYLLSINFQVLLSHPLPHTPQSIYRLPMHQDNILKNDLCHLIWISVLLCHWPINVWAQSQNPLGGYPLIEKSNISSPFGRRSSPFTGEHETHEGMDIPAQAGSPILATGDGQITYAGYAPGYGNLIEIDHGQGYTTRYGHAKTVLVKIGEWVKQSQQIATVGSTGRSTGPHLHFEVSFNKVPFDPKVLLGANYLNNVSKTSSLLVFTSTKLKAPWQLRQMANGKYKGGIIYTSKNTRPSGQPFVIVRSHVSVKTE